jgi:hypothetical protein
MILRILAASLVALGLGLIVEEAHARETVLCRDGRIVALDTPKRALADPCQKPRDDRQAQAQKAKPPLTVPLPMKRPARVAATELKGPAEETRSAAMDEPFRQAATDYRRVRIINARPGGRVWFDHSR